MVRRIIFSLLPVLFPLMVSAQSLAFPESGGDGTPARAEGAFVIGWKSYPGAIAYEYVLTNNFLCFIGCAGDTRHFTVTDTFAIEYELIPETWYYWITRMHFADSVASDWTAISNFYTPRFEDQEPLIWYPNPVSGDEVFMKVDWTAEPEAVRAVARLLSTDGRQIAASAAMTQSAGELRFSETRLGLEGVGPGMYLLQTAFFDSRGQLLSRRMAKVLRR
jgi:hypothetical protein